MTPGLPTHRPILRPYTQGLRPRTSKRSRTLARGIWLTSEQWRWVRAQGGGPFLSAMVTRLMVGEAQPGEIRIPTESVFAMVQQLREARTALRRALLPDNPAQRLSAIDDCRELLEGALREVEHHCAEASALATEMHQPDPDTDKPVPALRPYGVFHPSEGGHNV